MAKNKAVDDVKLKFARDARKNFEEFAKFYYTPPPNEFWKQEFTPVQGGGYWQIGTDPGKVNGKEIKTPIEEWVERWIDELGTQ